MTHTQLLQHNLELQVELERLYKRVELLEIQLNAALRALDDDSPTKPLPKTLSQLKHKKPTKL